MYINVYIVIGIQTFYDNNVDADANDADDIFMVMMIIILMITTGINPFTADPVKALHFAIVV